MIDFVRKFYRQQRFNPTFPLGLIFNDQYLPKIGIRNFIKEGASKFSGDVLDVGCGWKPYRQFFACTSYVGLDLEKAEKDNVKRSAADFYYDGLIMPFNNDQFDHVVTTEVIEHVANPSGFVQEIYRVLKPEGEVMLTTPFVWHEHGAPYDFQRFTSFGIDHLMEDHGFKKVMGKKLLDGPELFPVLVILYFNDTLSRLVKKLNNSRLLSILLFLLMRPLILVLNLLTLILSIFPRDKNLYFNNGVIYRKVTITD